MSYTRAICEKSVHLVKVPCGNGEEIIGQNISELGIQLYTKGFGKGVGPSALLQSFLVEQVRGNVLSEGLFASFQLMKHKPFECEYFL